MCSSKNIEGQKYVRTIAVRIYTVLVEKHDSFFVIIDGKLVTKGKKVLVGNTQGLLYIFLILAVIEFEGIKIANLSIPGIFYG